MDEWTDEQLEQAQRNARQTHRRKPDGRPRPDREGRGGGFSALADIGPAPTSDPPPPGSCAGLRTRDCGEETFARWLPIGAGRWYRPSACPTCLAVEQEVENWGKQIAAWEEGRRRRVEAYIPKLFREATFASYRCPPGDEAAREAVEGWDGRRGLFVWGDRGAGKTHLLYALVRQILGRRLPWRDVVARVAVGLGPDLVEPTLRELEAAYPEGAPRARFGIEAYYLPKLVERMVAGIFDEDGGLTSAERERLRKVPVLVVDDLGAAPMTRPQREQLMLLVRERYHAAVPTLLATEVDPGALAQRLSPVDDPGYGDRLVSPLLEVCDVVHVAAEDYRVWLYRQRAAEVVPSKGRKE